MEKTGKTVLSNMIWRFLERFGAQGVAFIVQIVLARLLEPDIYGTIALITVFTSILNVFIDSGFGNALIQKKNADEIDFSTVFYFNIVMCSSLYILMFFAAPFIALFYKDTSLTPVIRVLSLTLVISGVKNVQQAYVARTLQFKRFFFATLGGTIGAAFLGIFLAYKGFGVWALVAQQLFNATVDTSILWFTVKWRPKWVFSFQRLKQLFSYGWKLLVSSLLERAYNEVRQLIIGKVYSSADLAYYNRGRQFPYFFITNINSAIDSVLLPTMSSEQDNKIRVKEMTRRAIKTSTYVMAPIMMGMAALSKPMIYFLLTEKWASCIPFLRIFCFIFMFYPIHTANLNAIKAMGRSDLFLKLELIKKAIGIVVLLSTMWFGVKAMAYGALFESIVSQLINSWPNKKLLGYSYLDQIKDILPSIGISLIMGIIVFSIQFWGLNDLFTLLIQIPLGIIVYILLSKLFKIDSLNYIIGILKKH